MAVEYSELSNGMKVVTEHMDSVDTVSLGIWLPYGSRDETPEEGGMFHFIEHTLFKGTPTRNARQIAEDVEGIGGMLDAFTSKEETCYSIKVRAKHLDMTLTILADMLQNPAFRPEELERERHVIIEEIKMEEDNPEDVVFEKSVAQFWDGHSLARPILGTSENVLSFQSQGVNTFHKRVYTTDRMVVAAAGNLDHAKLCQRIADLFPENRGHANDMPLRIEPQHKAFQTYLHDPHLEQVNFCMHFKGLSGSDPRRYIMYLLNTILGGGMSSRLFQTIREEHGLAYHVGAFTSTFSDCGQFSIYGGCTPQNFERVIQLCCEEISRLKRNGIDDGELYRAREQFTASLLMGLESTTSRASALARDMVCLDRIFDPKRTISVVEAITRAEVEAMADELLIDETLGFCALGRLDDKKLKNDWSVA